MNKTTNEQIFLVTYDHDTTAEEVPDGWGVAGHTDIIGAFSTKTAAQKCIDQLIEQHNDTNKRLSNYIKSLYNITPLMIDAKINYDKPSQNEVGFVSYFEWTKEDD